MPIAPSRRSARRGIARLLTVAAAIGVLVVAAPVGAAHAAGPPGTVFQPIAPARLADTRAADCTCTRIDANTIRVQVQGRPGVPDATSAVALSLTVTGAANTGYATIWPSGAAMPGTSNINWTAGQTRANGVILALGAGGSVDVYVSSAAQVIVDISGAFTAAPGPVAAGRFTSMTPLRALDTRGTGKRVASGSVVTVPLPAGVAADATALAVTITVTDSVGFGFVTAYPSGAPRPGSSVVNTDQAGQTRAATAIVPVSPAGIDLYVEGSAHVLVDVSGWFTGASSPAATTGLFVPNAPLRVWDTRAPRTPVWTGGTMEIYPTDGPSSQLWSQLSGASSLVFNLTVTETSFPGWMTAYPARTDRPGTSTINWGPDETVANLAISPLSNVLTGSTPSFGVAFYGFAEADILVDITGYFTGSPMPGPLPRAANLSPGYTGEPTRDLVRDSVPASVFAVLGDVDMATEPVLPEGAAGYASTPPDRIRVAQLVYVNYRRNVARSVAAHEVGHILTFRWINDGHPESAVDTIGGHECIAEAIGRLLFAELGRSNYSPGYGGQFDACATAPATVSLANDIVNSQT
jgi:hypothetical protein